MLAQQHTHTFSTLHASKAPAVPAVSGTWWMPLLERVANPCRGRETRRSERRMRNEQWLRCCREGSRDRALALGSLTAVFLDVPGSSFREREVRTAGDTRGGLWGEVLEGMMNVHGIFQECQMELFRGGLLNEGRCGPPREITGSSFFCCLPFSLLHTHTCTHAHQIDPQTHSRATIWPLMGGESLRM